ncbi:Sec-independent protein translocase protein TatA [Pseudoclavibacter triregionum]|nr:Sec-independent protein translocase protein TatA [Pseudoclavibacter triregionum]
MFANLSGWHFLLLLVIILLLFGAPKLPQLARSLGQSMRIFRGEMRQMKDDDPVGPTAAGTTSGPTAAGTTSGTAAAPVVDPAASAPATAQAEQPVRPGDAERPQA